MNQVFLQNGFIIKRQGLSIGGKYKVMGMAGKETLMFVESKTKWIPPSKTVHVYSDENKTHELLSLKDRPEGGIDEMDVFDTESGQKIGAFIIGANNVSEIFKDVWDILDSNDRPIGKVTEKSVGQSLARSLITHDLPQHFSLYIGDLEVGELNQIVKALNYQLDLDFSKDVSTILDHRLGIAAGLILAIHQGEEID